MTERVLVTGATGFLGRAIVGRLEDENCLVRTTGRRFDGALPDFHPTDITQNVDPALLDGVHTVIHSAGLAHQFGSAAQDSEAFHRVNTLGARHIAEAAAAANVRHFILISSVSVYGDNRTAGELVDEDAPPQPVGPYAHSKRDAELEVNRVATWHGMPTTILRMATLYGEEDPGNVGRLIRTIDRGRFVWIGRGRNLKSLIHRDDAALACIAARRENSLETACRTYNVTAAPVTMRDVVEQITTQLEKRISRIRVPGRLTTAALEIPSRINRRAARLRGTIRKWLADDAYDGSRFSADFGFTPRISLSDGIGREVAWYREACQFNSAAAKAEPRFTPATSGTTDVQTTL